MIQYLRPDGFTDVGKVIGIDKETCCHHKMGQIARILKKNALGLPQKVDWMKDVLEYVVGNKIGHVKQISYNHVINDICPGHTVECLTRFANYIIWQLREKGKIEHKNHYTRYVEQT